MKKCEAGVKFSGRAALLVWTENETHSIFRYFCSLLLITSYYVLNIVNLMDRILMECKKNNFFDSTINDRLEETIQVLSRLKEFTTDIEQAAQIILNCFKSGNKLLICGNGGSAADAQHIAAEFVGKFYKIDRPALPAIALNTNTSIITAIGNDFGYDGTFKRQVEAFGQKEDVLLAISTSGNSLNVIEAIKAATAKEMIIISLTGQTGGEMAKVSHITIKVPSTNTPIIQNAHITICHTICEIVENYF